MPTKAEDQRRRVAARTTTRGTSLFSQRSEVGVRGIELTATASFVARRGWGAKMIWCILS
jgi:hypothetical protein